jgi:hypothetical protein
MAVPGIPSVTTIVTQALKRAGRTSPTAAQITEASEHAIQEVKSDIAIVAPTHPNLLVTATTVTTKGLQRYAFPDDYHQPYSLMLLDGPEEWRLTVQDSTATSVTLPSSISLEERDIVGKYILVTSGDGAEEYREVISWDNTTKVATVEAPWEEQPVAGSTVLIVNAYTKLWPMSATVDFDSIQHSTGIGKPRVAAENGLEYLLYPVPDLSTYGILTRYYVDLSKLDEDGTTFRQLLREWRSLWIQGIAVKSMQRFDEDRYQLELGVYNTMLTALGSHTTTVNPGYFKDV